MLFKAGQIRFLKKAISLITKQFILDDPDLSAHLDWKQIRFDFKLKKY